MPCHALWLPTKATQSLTLGPATDTLDSSCGGHEGDGVSALTDQPPQDSATLMWEKHQVESSFLPWMGEGGFAGRSPLSTF